MCYLCNLSTSHSHYGWAEHWEMLRRNKQREDALAAGKAWCPNCNVVVDNPFTVHYQGKPYLSHGCLAVLETAAKKEQ